LVFGEYRFELSFSAREDLERRVEERTQKLTEEIRIREIAEEELRHANAFLDSIIENIPDMIFLKDSDHLRFVRFNKAGEDLIGLSREVMLDKNDYDFFPQEQAKFFIEKDREVLKNKKIVNIPEEPIHTAKGETRYLHTKKIPLLDEKGEPRYLLGISEDITDKKLAQEKEKKWQEQLLQAEKLSSIGLLAAGVAHELNNPLTGLISMLRVYRKRKNEDSEDYRELTEMLLASDHMAKVIEDLNDFSRMSSPNQQALDLYDVIESTLSFSEHQLKQHDIRTTKYYGKDVPKIIGSKPQLQQVILNLLMNAKDAIGDKGEVTIKTGCSGDKKMVYLEVIDTGCGISAENLSRIFDPFFTTKVVGKGIGLGLSVLHGIIKNHNGEVLVESQPDSSPRALVH
jgi:PAS domain S-box-containing protein